VKTATNNDMPVRWMVPSDSSDVLQILKLNDNDMSKKDLAAMRQEDICMCAFDGIFGQAIGVVGYKLKPKSFELLMFYAHPKYDTIEIFEVLINSIFKKLDKNTKNRVIFWVPEEDLDVQLFLKDKGFLAIDVDDDAYLMEYRL
jgi:hypothetical protein